MEPPAKKNKRSYEAEFKLKVVKHAEKFSKNNASKVFQVDRRRVIDWCRQKEQLAGSGRSSKRLCGGGRKALSTPIENKLVELIRTKRQEKLRVTRKMVCLEAIKLHRQEGNEDFKASQGWLFNFMKRHKIGLRRKTTISQRLPRDLVPEIVKHIISIRRLRMKHDYEMQFLGAMDETPLWLDMPAATTLDFCGERSIPIKTSGHEKVCDSTTCSL